MSNILLEPWIGKNYNSGGKFKKKILALGHCHYTQSEKTIERPKHPDFTKEIIKDYLGSGGSYYANWMNTYKNFEKALVNKKEIDSNESNKIWNSIAFCNYLHILVNEAMGVDIPDKYYNEAETPFFNILDKNRPDLIIVWGRSDLWEKMPDGDDKYEIESPYTGYYILKDGTKIRTIAIHHPCCYFSWSKWYNFIKDYLY